jgi:hypothetical protein
MRRSADGKLVWWTHDQSRLNLLYGAGRSGEIETTAMAAIALLKSAQDAASVRGALHWLIQSKDSYGTWHSTQATVLAMKALLEGYGKPMGNGDARTIQIAVDDQIVKEMVIPADQGDVVNRVDLTKYVSSGTHALQVTCPTELAYHIASVYYVPESEEPPATEAPFLVSLDLDRQAISPGGQVVATVRITNQLNEPMPMVMAQLPIPPGFVYESGSLKSACDTEIARSQVKASHIDLYLRGLPSQRRFEARYQLRAATPADVEVPAVLAYCYYEPEKRGHSKAIRLLVNEQTTE